MTEPKEAKEPASEHVETPRGRFGRSGLRELEALRRALEDARNIESEDREKKVAIAEKRIELFMYEHDAAGAFKFKRFAREMLATMDENSVERTPDGRLAFSGKEKESRLMFVNMGELDRFNKEGGSHGSGDKALIETVRAIEAAMSRVVDDAAKQGKEVAYSVYRYAGNEYAVRLDGADEVAFEAALAEIRGAEPRVEGVEEPAPIVAEGFTMSEALEILSDVEEQMPDEDRIGPEDRNALTRAYIDIMRRRADYSLDVDKFLKRADRVLQKIAAGDMAAAKAFFDNYAAKGFKGAGPNGEDLDFDHFVELSRLEGNERFGATHDLEERALGGAAKHLGIAAVERDAKSAVAVAFAAGRRRRVSLRPPAPIKPGTVIAEIPTASAGHAIMSEKRQAFDRAVADGKSEDEVALARLEMQIEDARRDGSVTEGKFTGTGLLDRGSYYERLGQAFEKNDAKPRTTVFIDMGFLKYFDQSGGRDVGNDALRLAASLMERTTEVSGIKAEVFRYGGDEFTVIIEGGEKETDKYMVTLEKLRGDAGAVGPGTLGGEKGYVPTELSFNYGVADMVTADAAYADLVARGLVPEGGDVANLKAELMTLIADKAIEEQKAADRIGLLVRKMSRAKRKGDKDALAHAEALLAYSMKAIRGEMGGEAFVRSLVDGPDVPEDDEERARWVDSRIDEWVSSRTAEKKQGNSDTKRDRLIDALVENYGRTAYYERKYRQERERNKELDDENHALRRKIEALLKERKDLLDLRGIIGT